MIVRALCTKPLDHADHTGTLPDNFAGKFEQTESGCWVWTKAIQTRGYGSVGIGQGKTGLAHRTAWQSWFGPIPPRTQENTKVRTRKNGWINRCCKTCFLNATRLYRQRQREAREQAA